MVPSLEAEVSIGDGIIFLQTARDTNGALLKFDDYLQPNGQGPVEHSHPHQEERLTVLAGTAGVLSAGHARRLSGGGGGMRVLFALLAPVAKLRGYRTWYRQYSSDI